MLSSRFTLVSALCALVLLQQSTSVNGDFAGTYIRTSISPSVCVAPTICNYQCSAVYTIGVSGSTATLYPTSNPFGCACETLTASIVGDSASGKSSTSTYLLTRTATGLDVIASVLGVTCTASYLGGTMTAPTTPSASSTTTPSPSPSPMKASGSSSTTTPSPSPSPTKASGSSSVNAHLGLLGVTITASTALALSYI